MHRHVIAHCEYFAVAIVNRTRIVATLLDICRECGAAQRSSHFFRYGMENIFENFKPHGVEMARFAQVLSDHGASQLCQLCTAVFGRMGPPVPASRGERARLHCIRR